MKKDEVAELLGINQQLLNAIAAGDWQTYERLCDPGLTAFEPEAVGQLVAGMAFHQFYFNLPRDDAPPRPVGTTMASPHVRIMGDVAIVAYVRLTQRVSADGDPTMSAYEETRIWQRQDGQWKHVHFHRSRPAGA